MTNAEIVYVRGIEADNDELRADNERLRLEVHLLTVSRREIMKIDEERVAEVERLRMQLADHGEHITRLETANERLRAERDELKSERINLRLRIAELEFQRDYTRAVETAARLFLDEQTDENAAALAAALEPKP